MKKNHSHTPKGSKNILIAFALNASFSIIEFLGGYFTNSVAIYSDALHDLGDSIALLLSYFAEKLSQKQADKKFTFGYRRLSVLAALINGLILLSGSIFVIYEAVARLFLPEKVIAEGMLGLAILGILVNSIAAYRLSKDEGINSKMVMYHLFEDLFGWVAVLIVSIVLLFKPWYILDSILSILVSLVILRGVYKNLKQVGMIFLQKFPDGLELEKIESELLKLPEVVGVHSVKGWSLDGQSHYLRLHLNVPPGSKIEELDNTKRKLREILKEKGVLYSTIEFEAVDYQCADSKDER